MSRKSSDRGYTGDAGADKWTYTLHQAYIYKRGIGKVNEQHNEINLFHLTTFFMIKLRVVAQSQTCTQQGRTEEWEKAMEA